MAKSTPAIWKRKKTQLYAIRIPCRPCRGGQGEPPEQNFTKREKWTTRRCQARTIFVGGACINLDLDLVSPPRFPEAVDAAAAVLDRMYATDPFTP